MNPKDSVGAKKAPLGYVPPALVIGASEAMAVGAQKYGPFNWREQPVQYVTYLEAILRHLLALMDGQDRAEDTGIHHMKHIAAGAAIVLDALAAENIIDNRPMRGPADDMLRALDMSGVKDALALTPPCGGDEACDGSCRIPEELDPFLTEQQVEDFIRELNRVDGFPDDGPVDGRLTLEMRGDMSPVFRYGGYCLDCGSSEHTLSCPKFGR